MIDTPKARTKRILLVEDDEVLLETLKTCLQAANYEVLVASGGRWATHVLSADRVDLVISDISMSDMDGLELLESIRKKGPMPVILMTAFADESERGRARSLAVDGFILKPFRCNELVSEVKKILKEG